jgi:hypothetical protein
LRSQNRGLFFAQLEHEVLRKAVAIPLHLLDQPPGFDAIKIGKIFIEHHLASADDQDPLLYIAGAATSSNESVFSAA